MANRLKNILSFAGLAVGVPVSIPHLLNVNSVAQIPDLVAPAQGFFTITADATNVTVTRLVGDPDNVNVYAEVWHTFDRVFGANGQFQPTGLTPRPFVVRPGFGSSGALANAGVTRWDGFVTPLAAATTAPYRPASSADLITNTIGQMKPGSVVGLYVLQGPLTGGTFTVNVVRFAGSTGAPIPLGPGTLELVLSFGGPNTFTAFGTFAQGAFPYSAGDSLGLQYTSNAGFTGGEGGGSVGAILMQDD